MAYCKRVPAFPIAQGEALLNETAGRLSDDAALTPEILDGLYSSMSTVRRELHANPEPGFEEHKTQALLKKLLVQLAGIPEGAIRACAGTGLVADIKGSGPQSRGPIKTIALRADMDALRMTEGKNGLPYRSSQEGVAHLCGHDGHMASLLGAATLIQRRSARLPSDCTVRLLFQPAEEGPGGAAPMISEGCLDGVDECYGYHNWPTFEYGKMSVCAGPIMAHPTSFTIVITGKGGHGSQPHLTVDPVLTAAHVIVALQSVVSRSVHSAQQAVLSVTMVHGGEVSNVIPDTVTLQGTIRDLDQEVYEHIVERARAIVNGTCTAFGATATFQFESMCESCKSRARSASARVSLPHPQRESCAATADSPPRLAPPCRPGAQKPRRAGRHRGRSRPEAPRRSRRRQWRGAANHGRRGLCLLPSEGAGMLFLPRRQGALAHRLEPRGLRRRLALQLHVP